jgi:hypothetical protein
MRKLLALLTPLSAMAALVAFPADSEAQILLRRARARSQCPPVVYICPPAAAPVERVVSMKTGRVYSLIDDLTTVESYEKDVRAPLPTAKGIDQFNSFTGKSRRVAKITIADAPIEDFASVSEVFTGSNKLKPDEEMKELGIPAGQGSEGSDRVAAEKRTLRIRAFLYHYSKQDDNDYHLIIGDPPGTPEPRFMNVEISALPTDEDEPTPATLNTLKTVRDTFKSQFNLTNAKKRKVVDPPIEVIVTGSAFWDAEHKPPHTVGPKDFKPKSAWEIHPITNIVFEP